MLISYNWLKEYIGESDLIAAKAAELLGAHSFEIEGFEEKDGDTVIDVDILPNRASDCLSHRGIARELATITNTPLSNDPLQQKLDLKQTDLIEVEIAEPQACPRFTAALLTGIEVKESPEWLKNRLKVIGQRPINNIVDATNYVMFAIGQPLHAYDADLFPQVAGKWHFGVRFAKAGEVVSLIAEGGKDEDRNIELIGSELLIIDSSSNTPISLAGVKGGRFAGVHSGTKKIIIEAAHFDPIITRKTARRLGIVIDASKRFENEPSRELPPYALAEIIELIKTIAGGKDEGCVDVYLKKQTLSTVEVSTLRVKSLLGLEITTDEMVDILQRVGCTVSVSGEILSATGPWERTDLNIEEDFIEEIGRIYGYEHIKSIPPVAVPLREVNKKQFYGDKIRSLLLAEGYCEVITSSFRKKGDVQLLNALASDKSYLRPDLSKNLAEVLDKNAVFADLLGINDTRIFEIGTVFKQGEDTVLEDVHLAIGLRLKTTGYSGKEDKFLLPVLDKIQTALGIKIVWNITKGIAETNLTALFDVLEVPTAYEPVEKAEEISYQAFSVYPFVSRDIAMWVEGEVESVANTLRETAGDLCVRLTHLDTFTKDGRTSLAFRLVFQARDRTLTDDEVNLVMDKLYKLAEDRKWEVR